MESKTIKTSGGITVRVIETINGFRTKFGYWPDKLEADADLIVTLVTRCLTPLGFFLLQQKIYVIVCENYKILAGDAFDYGED